MSEWNPGNSTFVLFIFTYPISLYYSYLTCDNHVSPAYLSCNEYSREAGEGDDNHMEGVADEILGAE